MEFWFFPGSGNSACDFLLRIWSWYMFQLKKVRYAFAGLGGISLVSVAAYHLFGHVRQRVEIWQDPFADYEHSGYQIVQSLFGICAGGWFGTGLFNGSPDKIPLATMDFTFAAICEEFGIVFAICLILLCMSTFLLIVNIAVKMSKPFYRLIAIGLGTLYALQVFLTIGGTTKFIPMTGITLPLVSYGGGSVMCTIIMLAIIQGLYVLREDEGEELEKQSKKRPQNNPKKTSKGDKIQGRQTKASGYQRKREARGTGQERMTSNKKSQNKTEKVSIGRQYLIVSLSVRHNFPALIGYLVYFNVYMREDYQNSPYN